MTFKELDSLIKEAGYRGTSDLSGSHITIQTIDQFGEIFAAGISEELRKQFSDSLPKSSSEDVLRELADYVYGSCYVKEIFPVKVKMRKPLSRLAVEYINKVFPLKAKAVSEHNVVIDKDIVFGPSASPQIINADTLTFDGGSITAVTTSLSINANKLIITGKSSSNPYHVGVFGRKGSDGADGNPGKHYTSPAVAGHDSSAPTPGICTGASNGGKGDNGLKGFPGEDGKDGKDGQPNMPANISIADMGDKSKEMPVFCPSCGTANVVILDTETANFVVSTYSGAGGAGGIGQTGGNGGNGCRTGCEGTDGGQAGDGGDGGDGGNGGNGGNGASGNPITITFPIKDKNYLQTVSTTAPLGSGGDEGRAGVGGDGGTGGAGGKHKTNGSSGGQGKYGEKGKKGADGTRPGAPGNIVFHYTP